ncbi:dihydroorotate dehydrogenase signature 2 [Lucifera butyrica]|uniref:Dihydroorotate dehydrogenase n=1 Tax=Lucifera butyrica TaxID=1351585 RepID=A0A498RAY5_9FIRM|nr:dihydroorotate dehydrogenase [Lucifera butyrica]VBB06278.1 dihydroorotate dehydrogenase signature 2 [Lucifera butyrica]
MSRLQVEIAGIQMKTPVMAASGTFGFGLEYGELVDLNQVGAIVVKGTTLKPKPGNAGRRIAETPAGMLNAIGLENPGVDELVAQILPRLAPYDVPVIVNISGNTAEEYGQLASRLDVPGIAALEVNISCPNVKQGGLAFGTQCDSAAAVVSEVKRHSRLPVIVKLSPNVTDIVAVAQAVEAAGADAISLINTLLGMAINIQSRRPVLGNIMGGLSGPAVKPVAVRMVWQVARAVRVPVIGMGGIVTAEDAVEFFLAGARAVAIGTANFVNPRATVQVAEGLENYLASQGLTHISQLVGQVILE